MSGRRKRSTFRSRHQRHGTPLALPNVTRELHAAEAIVRVFGPRVFGPSAGGDRRARVGVEVTPTPQ